MKIRSALLAMAALAITFAATADNHEEDPPDLADVWVFAPKADMADKFYEAMENYMAWRAEVGDSRSWLAFTPVVGHEMNRVMYRACCYEWADQDTYLAEGIEKNYGGKFDEMVGPYTDHFHRFIDRIDFENSHWTDDEKGPYFGVTTWYMNEEFTPQAGEARKTMSAIAKDGWASDSNQWLWVIQIGGASTISVVSPYSSWAEMAPPEVSFFEHVSEKLGSEEETAKLFSDFSAGKVKSDYTVWRFVEEISSVSD